MQAGLEGSKENTPSNASHSVEKHLRFTPKNGLKMALVDRKQRKPSTQINSEEALVRKVDECKSSRLLSAAVL